MQRDLQFLLDMLQSAELILTYTAQCSQDEFIANVQLQDAVIRRLLVIAEAARRVSDASRQALPNNPEILIKSKYRRLYRIKPPNIWLIELNSQVAVCESYFC